MNEDLQKKYRALFDSQEGKEVLKDLLVFCDYDAPTFVAGDPCSTAYNEGKRRVALRISSFLKKKDPAVDAVGLDAFDN